MPFEKGNNLGTGRPKGSPNKFSAEIKEILLNDFHEINKRLDFDKMSQGELLKARQIITPYLTPKEIKNIEECGECPEQPLFE
tara:strand:- start:497 stop:745 length:249 start_codon:yes stop_codon:yes gene_type:complete